jgi:hypothetical protein
MPKLYDCCFPVAIINTFVLLLLLQKVTAPMIMGAVNNGMNEANLKADGLKRGVDRRWVRRWVHDNGLKFKAGRPLESVRAQWTTSKNMEVHYDLTAENLVRIGAAIWNPEFDPEKPYDQMIFVVKPWMLYSFDECQTNMDQTTVKRAQGDLGVFLSNDKDNGDVLATKSGNSITLVAGSRADGQSIPPMIVFSQPVQGEWLKDLPSASICDKNHKPFPATIFINKSGGMEKGLTTRFIQTNIVPTLGQSTSEEDDDVVPDTQDAGAEGDAQDPGAQDEDCDVATEVNVVPDTVAAEDPPCLPEAEVAVLEKAMVLCDGHGDHITASCVKVMRENHICCLLRPPHTSHVIQVEDVGNFAQLGTGFRQSKHSRLAAVMFAENRMSLKVEDYAACIAAPFNAAFCYDKNKAGWAKSGYMPFTRAPMWDQRAKEENAHKDSGGLRARLIPEYIKKRKRGAEDPASVVGEDPASDAVDEGEAEKKKKSSRLTAADLWDLGPVTGEAAFEIIINKDDEVEGKKLDKAEKQRIAADAAGERSAALAVIAVRAQAAIREKGSEGLHSLTVQELTAVLAVRNVKKAGSDKKADLQLKVARILNLLPPAPDLSASTPQQAIVALPETPVNDLHMGPGTQATSCNGEHNLAPPSANNRDTDTTFVDAALDNVFKLPGGGSSDEAASSDGDGSSDCDGGSDGSGDEDNSDSSEDEGGLVGQ